jgi:hypothetical protein
MLQRKLQDCLSSRPENHQDRITQRIDFREATHVTLRQACIFNRGGMVCDHQHGPGVFVDSLIRAPHSSKCREL